MKCKCNKGNVTLFTFANFAYVSSYFQRKTFGSKQDCVIFSKAQML